MSGNLTDVLALAEAINARKSSDDKFAELLGEVSTALAEILAVLENKAEAAPAIDSDALGKAIAAALVVGLRNMQPPRLELPAQAPSTPSWSTLSIKPVRDARGVAERYELTRK